MKSTMIGGVMVILMLAGCGNSDEKRVATYCQQMSAGLQREFDLAQREDYAERHRAGSGELLVTSLVERFDFCVDAANGEAALKEAFAAALRNYTDSVILDDRQKSVAALTELLVLVRRMEKLQ